MADDRVREAARIKATLEQHRHHEETPDHHCSCRPEPHPLRFWTQDGYENHLANVLADDAAERVREAQERALLDAADAIELPSLDDYANTPTDAEAAAKAWLCRRARIYADPPAPRGDAEEGA